MDQTDEVRGTTSHYNIGTAIDGAVFNLMGLMILLNSLLVAWLLVQFFLRAAPMEAALLWGIRLGLVVFLAASLEGLVMVNRAAHTVGLPDGGPGLPLINWSTRGGDLRIAHFIGLHALQLMPLAGWLLSRRWPRWAVRGVFALFAVYAGVFTFLLLQALSGRPLLPPASQEGGAGAPSHLTPGA